MLSPARCVLRELHLRSGEKTPIGDILAGILMMLDSQFELLHRRLDAQDRKLHEGLGTLATKDDLRIVERRLLGIEEFLRYLRGGGDADGRRELRFLRPKCGLPGFPALGRVFPVGSGPSAFLCARKASRFRPAVSGKVRYGRFGAAGDRIASRDSGSRLAAGGYTRCAETPHASTNGSRLADSDLVDLGGRGPGPDREWRLPDAEPTRSGRTAQGRSARPHHGRRRAPGAARDALGVGERVFADRRTDSGRLSADNRERESNVAGLGSRRAATRDRPHFGLHRAVRARIPDQGRVARCVRRTDPGSQRTVPGWRVRHHRADLHGGRTADGRGRRDRARAEALE